MRRALVTVALTLALTLVLALALGALSHAASPARTGSDPDFQWSGALAPGKSIEIHGINGAIRAERAAGDRVAVTAVKTARRSDPDEVRIEVEPHAGGVVICAIYPGRNGKPAGDCRPGGSHSHNTRNNDVEVNFRVRIPDGVRLAAYTVNGSISATGLESDVRATSVNGGIDVSTSRRARAVTVNGSIDVTMGQRPDDGDYAFETVNGSITVRMPEGIDAWLRASTVNGEITSDFPITVRGKFSRRSLKGTLGQGGSELRMETVNGDIRLLAAH
jgi:hypothetical protein